MFGVPVFNLQRPGTIDRLEKFLNLKIKRIYSLPEIGNINHEITSNQSFAVSLLEER